MPERGGGSLNPIANALTAAAATISNAVYQFRGDVLTGELTSKQWNVLTFNGTQSGRNQSNRSSRPERGKGHPGPLMLSFSMPTSTGAAAARHVLPNAYRGSPTAVPSYERRMSHRPKILGVLEAASSVRPGDKAVRPVWTVRPGLLLSARS
jgi:hypothetical protein